VVVVPFPLFLWFKAKTTALKPFVFPFISQKKLSVGPGNRTEIRGQALGKLKCICLQFGVGDHDPKPDPDPYTLVRGTDPRIRIRTKMSRISQHWFTLF
jgi:hypothetical protein